jgi:hypothetical protein
MKYQRTLINQTLKLMSILIINNFRREVNQSSLQEKGEILREEIL